MENSERDGNTRPPDLPHEHQLELDMEQWTASKLGSSNQGSILSPI